MSADFIIDTNAGPPEFFTLVSAPMPGVSPGASLPRGGTTAGEAPDNGSRMNLPMSLCQLSRCQQQVSSILIAFLVGMGLLFQAQDVKAVAREERLFLLDFITSLIDAGQELVSCRRPLGFTA